MGPAPDAGADVYGRVAPVPLAGSPLVDGALRSAGFLASVDALGRSALEDGDRDGITRYDIGATERPSTPCVSAGECDAYAGATRVEHVANRVAE